MITITQIMQQLDHVRVLADHNLVYEGDSIPMEFGNNIMIAKDFKTVECIHKFACHSGENVLVFIDSDDEQDIWEDIKESGILLMGEIFIVGFGKGK